MFNQNQFEMNKNKTAYFILASALVWGAVLIASSVILKGTPYRNPMYNVLLGGIAFHLLFIWGPLGNQLRRKDDADKENS